MFRMVGVRKHLTHFSIPDTRASQTGRLATSATYEQSDFNRMSPILAPPRAVLPVVWPIDRAFSQRSNKIQTLVSLHTRLRVVHPARKKRNVSNQKMTWKWWSSPNVANKMIFSSYYYCFDAWMLQNDSNRRKVYHYILDCSVDLGRKVTHNRNVSISGQLHSGPSVSLFM